MRSKKEIIIYISLIVLFSTATRLCFLNLMSKLDYNDFPYATEGILNLSGFKFSDYKTLKLDGQWEMYPSTFFNEDETYDISYIQVPGNWCKELDGFKKDEFTYGSYGLKIYLDDKETPLALKIDNISQAYKVFINNKLVAETGVVSSTSQLHKALRMPKIIELGKYNDSIEIVIQVSNSSGKGGIIKPIRLGTNKAIHTRLSITVGLQLLTATIFIFHCLYALILYFLRAKNSGLIYFALLMLFTAGSTLVADDKILLYLLKPSYEWHTKLTFLFFNIAVMLIPIMIYFLLDKNTNVALIYVFAFNSLAYTTFIVFAKSDLILATSWLLSLFMLLSIFLTMSMIIVALKNKEDLFFFFVASIFLCINIFWAIIQSKLSLDMTHYPFDLIFALLSFVTFWLNRYLESLAKVKNLADREVAWLQSQMHPHFIFNTLNSIASLSVMDLPKMQTLIEKFSDYLRLSFDFKNSDLTVDIHYELELVKAYVYIEQERFGSRLNVIWDIGDSINFSIPPLTIQPLVENSIKHGILSRHEGGTIKISIKRVQEYYKITVEDDGVGIRAKKESKREGKGLNNINKRLMQLYGKSLKIESEIDVGTKVSFKIKAP